MIKPIPLNASLVPDEAELVFKGKIFTTYQWQQTMFDGSNQTFEMLKRTDTVKVICLVKDKIIVLDEEQPFIGKHLGFPGGRVDDTDNSVLDAAKRETLEESGYSFSEWKLIEANQPYDKIEWFIYTFVASDPIETTTQNLDVGEKINVGLMTLSEIKQLIGAGKSRLGDTKDLLLSQDSIEDILSLPEFIGKDVDR